MAIQKSINIQHLGLSLADAYHKIDDIFIANKQVRFVVKSYVSKEARDNMASTINITNLTIQYDELLKYEGDDLIAKLYAFTKSIHPEFNSDTTDV